MSNTNNTKSNKQTVLNTLLSGKTVSATQLKNRYRINNAHEIVRDLRSEGYAVYTNTTADGKTSYRLGTPSRAMIAAAYNMGGSALFTRG